MFFRSLSIIFILTASVVCGQEEAPAGSGCTRYAPIDLYVVLDIYPTNAEIFNRSFKFVGSLIRAIDFNKTRIAVWTGNRCGILSTFDLCQTDEDFRFIWSDGQNERAMLIALQMIKNVLLPLGSQSKKDYAQRHFSPARIQGKLVTGMQWLGDLKYRKRSDAELVMLVLTPGLHPNEVRIVQQTDSHLGNMARFAIQLDAPWSNNDPAWQSLDKSRFSPQAQRIDRITPSNSAQLTSQRWLAEIISLMCSHTLDCHYEKNEAIRRLCRFDSQNNCYRNFTAGITIIHKEATGSGRPCSRMTVPCSIDECVQTCNDVETEQWQSWSECSCVQSAAVPGYEFHSRVPGIDETTIKVSTTTVTERSSQLTPVKSSMAPTQEPDTSTRQITTVTPTTTTFKTDAPTSIVMSTRPPVTSTRPINPATTPKPTRVTLTKEERFSKSEISMTAASEKPKRENSNGWLIVASVLFVLLLITIGLILYCFAIKNRLKGNVAGEKQKKICATSRLSDHSDASVEKSHKKRSPIGQGSKGVAAKFGSFNPVTGSVSKTSTGEKQLKLNQSQKSSSKKTMLSLPLHQSPTSSSS